MQAVARLHNFCINERIQLRSHGINLDAELSAAVREGRAFIPSVPHNEDRDPVELEPLFDSQVVQNYRGYSELRECMAVRVENKGLESVGLIQHKDTVSTA
jgi:hypothetical protein